MGDKRLEGEVRMQNKHDMILETAKSAFARKARFSADEGTPNLKGFIFWALFWALLKTGLGREIVSVLYDLVAEGNGTTKGG
jgi:hypothetical protein